MALGIVGGGDGSGDGSGDSSGGASSGDVSSTSDCLSDCLSDCVLVCASGCMSSASFTALPTHVACTSIRIPTIHYIAKHCKNAYGFPFLPASVAFPTRFARIDSFGNQSEWVLRKHLTEGSKRKRCRRQRL